MTDNTQELERVLNKEGKMKDFSPSELHLVFNTARAYLAAQQRPVSTDAITRASIEFEAANKKEIDNVCLCDFFETQAAIETIRSLLRQQSGWNYDIENAKGRHVWGINKDGYQAVIDYDKEKGWVQRSPYGDIYLFFDPVAYREIPPAPTAQHTENEK